MKQLITSLLLIAGCFTVTMAQQANNKKGVRGQMRAEKMMKEMTEKLSLTQEQQTKIKPILAERGQTMKANREKFKGNHKCLMQARYQANKADEAKIMALLTPGQQKKFLDIKKQKQEERKKKHEEEMMKPIDCR